MFCTQHQQRRGVFLLDLTIQNDDRTDLTAILDVKGIYCSLIWLDKEICYTSILLQGKSGVIYRYLRNSNPMVDARL